MLKQVVDDVHEKCVETDKMIKEQNDDVRDRLEHILKTHQREKSDLKGENHKLLNRVVISEKSITELFDSMHNICTVLLCLVEEACMQIRAEEQEDEDKESIALMGRKDAPEPTDG